MLPIVLHGEVLRMALPALAVLTTKLCAVSRGRAGVCQMQTGQRDLTLTKGNSMAHIVGDCWLLRDRRARAGSRVPTAPSAPQVKEVLRSDRSYSRSGLRVSENCSLYSGPSLSLSPGDRLSRDFAARWNPPLSRSGTGASQGVESSLVFDIEKVVGLGRVSAPGQE